VLIKTSLLKRIKLGQVTLAFRRRHRPTVKAGGSLKTTIGVLTIVNVEPTTVRSITRADAQQAGDGSKDALLKDLRNRGGGLYKITLAYAGDDPRIKLRVDNKLSNSDFAEICERLQRYDSASRAGAWTHRVLTAIRDNPKLVAAELARKTGFEKAWLKTNVRKLKNLGLTISQDVGYTLSPRGAAVLKRFERDA
jgi:hypothetical protein